MLPLDLADGRAVHRLLAETKPDVIVHTAASTNPDDCERDRGLAFRVNVKGTEHLVRFAEKIHAKLIFISTDLVYDGLRGNYAEEDPPNPLNYYAETKLKGEGLVARGCEDFVIFRMSLLYGWGNGINGSFTDEDPRVKGLFHMGGSERTNRYELGLRFCEVFGSRRSF